VHSHGGSGGSGGWEVATGQLPVPQLPGELRLVTADRQARLLAAAAVANTARRSCGGEGSSDHGLLAESGRPRGASVIVASVRACVGPAQGNAARGTPIACVRACFAMASSGSQLDAAGLPGPATLNVNHAVRSASAGVGAATDPGGGDEEDAPEK